MSGRGGGLVVVGISPSVAGLEALRYAVDEARRRRVPLHAARAWGLRVPWQGPDVRRWRDQFAGEALRCVGDAFDAATGGPPADVDVVVVTPEGRADMALTALVHGRRDLLVLGGRTGPRRQSWLVRECLRRAACPVVVVPPPDLATAGSRSSVRQLLREAEHHAAASARGTRTR